MRFEHDGMSLWYGTADAPAPEGAIQTGSDITITIGVQPTYASNKVDMLYRVNQGSVETIAAKWLRHDLSGKAQYFRARFPVLHVGDTVEYTAVCHCAGRQVPSPEEVKQLLSSFHVVAVGSAESKPVAASAIKEIAMLKTDGASSYNTGTTSPAAIASQPIAPSPESSQGPARDHPIPQHEAQKTALKSLLSTSPVMADAKLQDTFISLYAEHQGSIQDFWSKLREQPEFKAPGTVENIQFTLQLAVLTQNNPPLIQTLQGIRQQGNLQSIRDLTKLDTDAWTKLINNSDKGISIPANIPGETQEEKVANYVSTIIGSLQLAFPTSYVGQGVAKQPEIDLKLVKSVLAWNPSINPFHAAVTNLKMTGISAADQEKARASLEALRREVRMFPGLDYKTLLSTNAASSFQNPLRQALSQFFANAPDFDFRDTHIDSFITQNAATALKGIDDKYREAVPTQLKLMQRIFQVTPRYEAMSVLLGEGIHSAYRIARIPQTSFVGRFQDKLGGEEQARAIHAKANSITAMTTTLYSQYAHAFNNINPAAFGNFDDIFSKIPNYTQLFGSLDLCDCEHCHSVYSPAAYFVDLLQFLDNIGPSDYFPQTALEVLRTRRPDLEYIKLNCVNAETPMPYIDLVNEILESYIVYNQTLPYLGGIPPVPLPPGVSPLPYTPQPKDTPPDATAEELSVNPENTDDNAYQPLQIAVYPQILPYNRPLEVVRAYLKQLDSSRFEVMKAFQQHGTPSDLALASEYLLLSPEEQSIITNGSLTSAHGLWEFYGYPSQFIPLPPEGGPGPGPHPNIILSVSWEEFISQVPEFLSKVGITYTELIELLNIRFLNPTGSITLDFEPPKDAIMPNACDLQNIKITHLDDGILDKLHRFLRLWKKTGWTTRDLDKVLYALGATDIDGPMLQNIAIVKQLQAELNIPLVSLLSLWANIDTFGKDSLYNKLFQNKAILNPLDTTFMLQPDGSELLQTDAHISDHIPTILAALRVTATDLEALRVATDLVDHPEKHPPTFALLTLSNLSTLYRHTVLARALRLSIKDLIDIKILTGQDPFTDVNSTSAFVDEVHKIRQSGFTVAQLNYLYRHLYDPKRGIAPLQGNVDLLMKSLQAGLKKVVGDTVVMPDPSGDILRQKLAIVLDSKLVNAAMGLIDGSAIYMTSLASEPPTFPNSVKDKISYDGQNKKLLYTGNMTSADYTLLKPLGDMSYQNAIDDLFQQPRTFFAKNLTSFLDPNDASSHLLEDQPLPKETQPPTKEERINYALTAILAYLRTSLSQSLVKQLLSEALKLDTAMIDALLGSLLNVGAPLILKSRTNASQYAMADFLVLLDGGLSVTYFANKNLDSTTGTSVTRIDPTINFSWDTASPDPAIPGTTFSARWTGRVLAQNSETYILTTHTNNGVRLWVNNQLLIDDWHDQPATDHSATIALKAGQLYNITMEYYNDSAGAVAQLWWSSPSISKTIIPQGQFYPGSAFAAFSLLHKVALLANGFKITVPEVIYLSAHGTDIPGFDFNVLPLDPSGFSVALFDQWEQLYDLFTLRNNLPRGEVGLIDVFEAASIDELKTKLSAATSWDSVVINDLTGSGGFNLTTIDQFKKIEMLTQLYVCVMLSKRLGVSVAQLFAWAKNEPDASQAQEVKNTVKAKFDDEQWLTVGKTLNNKLRDSQKAALIAYILQLPDIKNAGITDSSRLYEYFLIDVDMTSCMMTSRIKQAISSVQLFIQRCLLNEEPEVDVTLIDVDLWSWMKHYRVWEANRKVFLYPENWIEPELRDDKSPFFKELESELLQKDITPDNVEQALLNYLEKLDEVSRLEICGMYWECESFPDRNILHVFGRTFTIPHVYYYRQLVNATTWTAWEKVNVNIEGDHLIPIVWNRRLHIFWPIFTEKSDDAEIPDPSIETSNNKTTLKTNASPPKKHWEIKLAWSEYKQNKWTPKQVSTDSEVIRVPDFLQLTLAALFGSDPKQPFLFKALIEDWSGDLKIQCYYPHFDIEGNIHKSGGVFIVGEFHLTGCRGRINIVPPDNKIHDFFLPKCCEVAYMTFELNNFKEDCSTNPLILFTENQIPGPDLLILNQAPTPYNLLYPHQFLQFVVQAPFFFQDSQRTYFVTPEWDTSMPIYIPRFDKNIPNGRSLIADGGKPATIDVSTSTANAGMKAGASATGEQHLVGSMAQLPTVGTSKTAIVTREPTMIDSIAPVTIATALQAITTSPFSLDTCGVETLTSCDAWGRAQPDMVVSKVKFANHYHPYVCNFIKVLNHYGIPRLLELPTQQYSSGPLEFTNHYDVVTGNVDSDYPVQDVDFNQGGAYALYNWELFFHIPLLIATKLSKNQQFEEAQQWFHYIFNPTDSTLDSWPKRLWRFFPFYNNTDTDKIQDLLALLDYKGDDLKKLKRRCEMIQKVQDWQHHPFDPHRIARFRMIAYQKNVFMKYIDNLIAWGDQLFRQDTIETINEATQLYILAYELLGPRPEDIPPRGVIEDKAYVDIQGDLDAFSNALVNLENQFPFSTTPSSVDTGSTGASGGLGIGTTFYFCIPKNDQLLGYWDIVADRLFKIRHCMNIEGVVQQLPLFEPPIEPGLLVQATAMGVDLNSALNDINAATPYYRFTYMLQKALELCSEVRGLGAALLSALEKKDAEALAAIRAGQETAILKAVRQVKEQQVTEAETSLEALNKTREVTNIRFMFYHTIEARTAFEMGQIVELTLAQMFQEIGQQHELGASIAHLIPDFDLGVSGFGGSPKSTASFGGANVAGALEAIGKQFASISSMHTYNANMASILGGWDRRAKEWSLQENLAAKELEQIDQQKIAAQIRLAIAQLELDNHDRQIENAQAIEDFLHDKYTNQDLYDWMVGQVSTVYKQCYQMAYDLAKRAEKAFRFERGLTSSNYITFGYWDSLKKGLLSGEQLYLDLKRMEMAYIDQNKREYEITRHISLLLFDPMALITLKETGTCLVKLPEALFDMDYPGHYMRRIKSVSLTIPCIAGPYTNINCTLTLLSNQIRKNADLPGVSDPYSGPKDDADALARFITTFGAVESIATSTAQNDSGMFEVNFRDERYLPFEGAGVVSTWRIDMPKDCNAFDFETISDVIIRLNYTAREGGARLSEEAKKVAQLPTPIMQGITTSDTHFPDQPNLTRIFSVKHEFSSDWYRFLHPTDITKDQQVLSLGLTQERFPFQFRGRQIDINSIKVFLKLNEKVFYNNDLIFVLREEDIKNSSQITDYPGTFNAIGSPIDKLPYAELFKDQAETVGQWKWAIVVASTDVSNLRSDPANPPLPSLKQTTKVNGKDYVWLNPDAIADIWIVCDYSAK